MDMQSVSPLYAHQTHTNADEYTYRVPTPPRIVVPPPTLNSNALPEFQLSALPGTSYLPTLSSKPLVNQNALIEWSYERRREAQAILPYLYLGPMSAARDRPFLTSNNITFLLGIRHKHGFESRLMTGVLRTADELGIANTTIDLADNQGLIAAFPRVSSIIVSHMREIHQKYRLQQSYSSLSSASESDALPANGKVLVFCESGNERAAGAVAAFLMENHADVDFVKAMQLVQAQRFCVNFDDGMKRLLQGYWDILLARRHCAEAAQLPVIVGDAVGRKVSAKRGLDRDEDGDCGMGDADVLNDDEDDRERFGGRIFAPFVDAE